MSRHPESSSIVGRTLPSPYPGGPREYTITSVNIGPSFVGELPVITAILTWSDGTETVGSLAPGTMLWQDLQSAGERDDSAEGARSTPTMGPM